jgi:hypothetical protein
VFTLFVIAGSFFITADTVFLIDDIRHGHTGLASFDAFMIALWLFILWMEWRDWKNDRKRITALIGAKSRALRDRLVRKMAEQGA